MREDEKARQRQAESCRYNDHVRCEENARRCGTCGWNPKVQRDRKRKRYNAEDRF